LTVKNLIDKSNKFNYILSNMPEGVKPHIEQGGLSSNVERFLGSYVRALKSGREPENAAKIHVSTVVGALSYIYERFRNIIDYKEEHLLRKNAILRILKRRIYPGAEADEIARPLIYELIRGGYLKNDTVPETKVLRVNELLSKYFYFLEQVSQLKPESFNEENVDWLWSVAAVEIEDTLVSKDRDRALLHFMLETITNRVEFSDLKVSEKERDYLLFIANLRSLWKADVDITRYELLRKFWPQWQTPTENDLEQRANDFAKTVEQIEYLIRKPVGEKLHRLFKKYTVHFDILRESLLEKPELAKTGFLPKDDFNNQIRKSCTRRYRETRSRLRRSMARSVVYIFVTKMLLALIIELPYDIFIAQELQYVPVAINILFPPFLMFMLGVTVRVPSDKNTELIVKGLNEIIFVPPEKQEKIVMETVTRRSKVAMVIYNIIYAIIFAGILGLIIYGLYRLNFNIVSGTIFIIFLSLISFFGFRIRSSAHELIVKKKSGGFLSFIFDVTFLPVIRLGRWISLKSAKINVMVFLLDVIIEAPFKTIIDYLEGLVGFLREKKEEVY